MPSNPLLGLNLHYTVPDQLTGSSSVPGSSRFVGGANQSLGGVKSLQPVPIYFPFLKEIEYAKVAQHTRDVPCSWHRLFKDFTSAQLTAGRTVYRGLQIHNDSDNTDFESLSIWVTQPQSGTAITVGLETPVAGVITRVANETSAPAGVVFSSPTEGAPLTGPAHMGVDKTHGIWIKQVVSAGQAAYPFDYWGLHIKMGTGSPRSWYFFQHLLAGVSISSVASNLTSGVSTYVNQGETFTITMSGGPTDPAQNTVYVLINGPEPFGDALDMPGISTTVDLAERSSAGVYTYGWTPSIPGFYTLEFNIGESYSRVERNVLP